MRSLRVMLVLVVALGLAACGNKQPSKIRDYYGPAVTQVQVHKEARKIYLLHDQRVLKEYDMALGFAPTGHKQFEGDGKTPEGAYYINWKNPNSEYHLSLMVSYPNTSDRVYAATMNKSPGGQIFIHGGPKRPVTQRDWTAGCVAVSDAQIEEIYAMVNVGTPIYILP